MANERAGLFAGLLAIIGILFGDEKIESLKVRSKVGRFGVRFHKYGVDASWMTEEGKEIILKNVIMGKSKKIDCELRMAYRQGDVVQYSIVKGLPKNKPVYQQPDMVTFCFQRRVDGPRAKVILREMKSGFRKFYLVSQVSAEVPV
uniref:Uncharacterized protein n=1 Tax=viral metagenome TaxID=1070528 RepID=A0A6M3LEU7_9ZZZZ